MIAAVRDADEQSRADAPDDSTNPLPKSPYGAKDDRSEEEKLTDYLIALANPSTNMRKKNPMITVFEEGDGGREGCRDGYWKQHFVGEPDLLIVDDEAPTGDRSESRSVEVWRTPDNEARNSTTC